ncbi:MAG: hypothetical protein OXE99_06585 [Cellvibrionales bacterium]|nr:hypothetical protein [Cellvibrionales bacterium]
MRVLNQENINKFNATAIKALFVVLIFGFGALIGTCSMGAYSGTNDGLNTPEIVYPNHLSIEQEKRLRKWQTLIDMQFANMFAGQSMDIRHIELGFLSENYAVWVYAIHWFDVWNNIPAAGIFNVHVKLDNSMFKVKLKGKEVLKGKLGEYNEPRRY